jgi:hypothetical protein
MSYNWENWSCECENEVGISAQDAWVVSARLPRMDLQATETLFYSGPCKLPSCLNYSESWRLENKFSLLRKCLGGPRITWISESGFCQSEWGVAKVQHNTVQMSV